MKTKKIANVIVYDTDGIRECYSFIGNKKKKEVKKFFLDKCIENDMFAEEEESEENGEKGAVKEAYKEALKKEIAMNEEELVIEIFYSEIIE